MSVVLITDGLLRKSLAMTRSLGKQGLEVWTAERIRMTPAACSRYCAGSLRSPDPAQEPDAYAKWLLDTLRARKFDLLIPSDDHALEIVLQHRAEVNAWTTCVLPPAESYSLASDKYQTMRLAEQSRVPHPATRWPSDVVEVALQAEQWVYPVVIKPRKSSGSRGIRIVHDPQELVRTYQEIDAQYPGPMIQEFIPAGDRFDVCLLYNLSGDVRASFVQREVRHFPLDIGPSTVQESVWMPELVEQAKQLLQHLPWQGVVEIEFMRDPRDGVPKLMEINPRFWNSLEMAVQAGVDFPHLLHQIALTGDAEEVHEYEVGRVCRNLLPSDSLHFLANGQRRQMSPPFLTGRKSGVQDDIWSWDDPWPVLGFLGSVASLAFDRKVWKMMFKR